jgi:adenylate cyclase
MTTTLRRLSIKTRILVVSAILMAILAGMTLYTTAQLAANSRAVAETAQLAGLSQLANQTRTAFGEYRYWLTDLAVSLLRLSELNAQAAMERLSAKLDELAGSRPEVAATIKQELYGRPARDRQYFPCFGASAQHCDRHTTHKFRK